MKNLVLLPILFTLANAGLSVDPLVHWSMDTYRGAILLPDFGDVDTYSSDLSALSSENYILPGVIGNALRVNGKKIKLIEDISRTDCVRNPVQCEDGLTISLWLKVEERTHRTGQIILRSTNPSRSRPGIYIGEDKEGALAFIVRTAEGKLYEASIEWSRVINVWTHLAMVWNSTSGIQVFVNGPRLEEQYDQYVKPPSVEDVSTSYPSTVDLIAGDILGPIFLLDDLWIFYNELTDEEIYSLYELGAPKEPVPTYPETTTSTSSGQLETRNATFETFEDTTAAHNISVDVTQTVPTVPYQRSTSPKFVNVTNMIMSTESTATSVSTTSTSQKPRRVMTVGPTTTTPSYNGWFYNQPWFYSFIAASFLIFLAVVIWLCVVHCCVPAVEEQRAVKLNGEQTIMEPLVEKT